MKKVISFSLWGSSPKYCVGAIKNAQLAFKHYPGWVCRYHVGSSTPQKYVEELESFSNTEILLRKEEGNWNSTFWRFLDASDLNADVMISRDADSRLNNREAAAVKEWLDGDKKFHIMRDHPHHATEILAGMWGVRNHFLGDMKHLINKYAKGDFWQVDQNFLREIIFPIVKNNCLVHDEFFGGKNFPTKRAGLEFVGQVFNENEEIVSEHLEALRQSMNKGN